jgi:hypothetical protein
MCYRTKLNSELTKIEQSFNAQFKELEAYSPQEEINAFTFMKTQVTTDENQGEI